MSSKTDVQRAAVERVAERIRAEIAADEHDGADCDASCLRCVLLTGKEIAARMALATYVCPRCGSGQPVCAERDEYGERHSHFSTCAMYEFAEDVCDRCAAEMDAADRIRQRLKLALLEHVNRRGVCACGRIGLDSLEAMADHLAGVTMAVLDREEGP